MKNIFPFAVLFFAAAQLCATFQIPDTLVHNGQKYGVDTTLFEPYFIKHPKKRPDKIIIDVKKLMHLATSGLKRDYIADFEIENKQLFAKDIRILPSFLLTKEDGESVFNKVFADTDKVKADWVTGVFATTGERIVTTSLTNWNEVSKN